MIDLPYSLVIEATEDPEFFAFFSEELAGFSGVGNSIEDCIYKAKWGMRDHLRTMCEQNLPAPPANPSPSVVIQNERKLQRV